MQTTHRPVAHRWAGRLCAGSGLLALSAALAASAPSLAGAASNSQFGVANGDVAAITGTSMEVQNPNNGQTTVSWTTSTAFTQVVSETLSAVTVGECVTVSGTTSKKSKTTIAARTISIEQSPASGSCTRGRGVGFGGAPGGFVRTQGGGAAPKGGAGGGGTQFFSGGGPGGRAPASRLTGPANFGLASGKVTAVHGSTVSLSGILAGANTRPARTSSAKGKRPAPLKTQKIKVTTTSKTTLSETQSTTSTALAVGDCVTAIGTAASTGAVTASRVNITSKGGSASSCSGLGGRFITGGGPPPGLPGAGA